MYVSDRLNNPNDLNPKFEGFFWRWQCHDKSKESRKSSPKHTVTRSIIAPAQALQQHPASACHDMMAIFLMSAALTISALTQITLACVFGLDCLADRSC